MLLIVTQEREHYAEDRRYQSRFMLDNLGFLNLLLLIARNKIQI